MTIFVLRPTPELARRERLMDDLYELNQELEDAWRAVHRWYMGERYMLPGDTEKIESLSRLGERMQVLAIRIKGEKEAQS